MALSTPDRDQVLSALEERTCNYCGTGELVRERYKGAPAVVCRDCDVPQVRFALTASAE